MRYSCNLLLILGLTCTFLFGCDIQDESVQPAAATTNQLLRADTAMLVDMLNHDSDAPAITPKSLEYVDGFDAGLKRAQSESKSLLVICRAAWCRWSAEMTQGPLSDPQIIGLASRFVCVMIDADRHADTCQNLDVTAFPTVIIISSIGDESFRTVGRPSTDTLLSALREHLQPSVAVHPTRPLQK
ncbi:MAG: thioredoxin domain-containing protein [Pirellulales bacterium]